MSPQPGSVCRFGPFRYDPAQRLLCRGDEPVQLLPKVADTLHALVERRGQVVAKADRMKAVWPDCVVEEIGLARNISLLRKALGDDAESYIETISKRGYRFTADADDSPLRPETSGPPAERSRWLLRRPRLTLVALVAIVLAATVYWQFYRPSRFLPRAAGAASLAVVPVACLSPDLERGGFADGFSEALVEELAKVGSIRVTSPATVQRYRRLGIPTAIMTRLLGLDVIVEGTAQAFGPTTRVSLRLTDVHSGKLIWAEGYDLPAEDLDQAEMAVARSAAAQVSRRLLPR